MVISPVLALVLFLIGSLAGVLGALLGLGGGVFLVPIFTLFFDVNQKLAIGASAIAPQHHKLFARLRTLVADTAAKRARVSAKERASEALRLYPHLHHEVLFRTGSHEMEQPCGAGLDQRHPLPCDRCHPKGLHD